MFVCLELINVNGPSSCLHATTQPGDSQQPLSFIHTYLAATFMSALATQLLARPFGRLFTLNSLKYTTSMSQPGKKIVSNMEHVFCFFLISFYLLIVLLFSNFAAFVEFEEVRKGLEDKSLMYLDVRNRSELENDGKVQGSVNLPCELFLSSMPFMRVAA